MDSSYCGDSLMGVSIAIIPVQIAVVCARFWTRHLQQITSTIDDYLIIPALVGSLGQSALFIVLLKVAGLGYHFLYIQQEAPEKLIALQKGLFASQILNYPFIVTPAEISILLFYNRIFSTFGWKFRSLSYAIGFIVLGTGIGVFFAAIFQCSPLQHAWDKSIKGSCFNQQQFFRFVSLPNILTDLVILVMPFPFVWKLHTRLTQKLALTGVFLLGGLGVVASILRMTIFFQEQILVDPTWVSVNLGIRSVLESAIIIITACLPPSWPLVAKFLPQRLTKRKASKKQEQQNAVGDIQLKRTSNGFSRLGEGSGSETAMWSTRDAYKLKDMAILDS
ncbi:hypothetical protein BJY04DRAFT_220042 [Aspergillus karnatakaensis]|uniref:uncharacterized protein n=1 Tax=Aspergillus karnatakaensis TaxID=1810916 RepID=UPI003CCDE63F